MRLLLIDRRVFRTDAFPNSGCISVALKNAVHEYLDTIRNLRIRPSSVQHPVAAGRRGVGLGRAFKQRFQLKILLALLDEEFQKVVRHVE